MTDVCALERRAIVRAFVEMPDLSTTSSWSYSAQAPMADTKIALDQPS
jgi:hypothetical protein